MPPAFVEAMRVNEPSGERDSKVEVEGSKEALAEEPFKKSRPAKVPTRPTVPMRSKSTRGVSAQKTTLRRARTAMQYQGGCRGCVIIVELLELLNTTYEGEVKGKVAGKEGEGAPDDEWSVHLRTGEPKRARSQRVQSSHQKFQQRER